MSTARELLLSIMGKHDFSVPAPAFDELVAALAGSAQPVAFDETALNTASWAFVKAMPYTLPGPIFNSLKGAVRAAIATYIDKAHPVGAVLPATDAPVDGLESVPRDSGTLAVIGRKHFGNPIPRAWYAAAKELLASQAQAPTAVQPPSSLGAPASPSGSAGSAPSPSVSALRAPIPGATDPTTEDPDCPKCKGAGERMLTTTHKGPDDYDYLAPCPDCNGTGGLLKPAHHMTHDELQREADALARRIAQGRSLAADASTVIELANRLISGRTSAARGIVSGAAGETPQAARPEGQEPVPAGARPSETSHQENKHG